MHSNKGHHGSSSPQIFVYDQQVSALSSLPHNSCEDFMVGRKMIVIIAQLASQKMMVHCCVALAVSMLQDDHNAVVLDMLWRWQS